MRSLVPAETLVYLETNDLAAALQPIVDSKPFAEVAKNKPDFSALKGVQLTVAVTGFETTEEKLTDENSVGRVQPHFVAVADTHAWNYQAVGFAEKKLGDFVANIYNSEPTLEKSDKNGGKYFTWIAKDGRKAYALVIDSLIYFGNDESSIEKCLAVKRGETDSIAKTGKVQPADPKTLASGYVSTDGIAQIASIIGLKFASETSEDSEVQSAIAGILPQLLRNSVTEVSWTATKTGQGIEDKYLVTMPPDVANVFNETMTPADVSEPEAASYLPANVASITRYNLKNARVAWRSVLLILQKQADPIARKIIGEVSGTFFEPYGVDDPELFLSSVGTQIVTVRLDMDSENAAAITSVIDKPKFDQSVSRTFDASRLKFKSEVGRVLFLSRNGDMALGEFGPQFVIGELTAVNLCLYEAADRPRFDKNPNAVRFFENHDFAATTYGIDTTSTGAIVDLIAPAGHGDTQTVSTYFTETRFTKTGIERRTVSDFGLIGSIIAQLGAEQ